MESINKTNVCLFQAHRGVSSDRPENTMCAYKEAVMQGYDIIELDPKFTGDNVCVILHDNSLNRTARDKNGLPPKKEQLLISDITYAEACEYEYGGWFDPAYKGEALPTLADALAFSKSEKIPLKFDNVVQSFSDEQLNMFFDEIEKQDCLSLVGFSASKLDYAERVLDRFPNATIHFDGLWNEEAKARLCSRVPKERLFVWVRYDNKATSWNKFPPASEKYCASIKQHAKLGIWLISEKEELVEAVIRFHADVIETNGKLKPVTSF